MENEFKCYLRPVIEDDQDGWGFLAANLKTSSSAIYPKIYNFRQQERQREEVRKENEVKLRRLKLQREEEKRKRIEEERKLKEAKELKEFLEKQFLKNTQKKGTRRASLQITTGSFLDKQLKNKKVLVDMFSPANTSDLAHDKPRSPTPQAE